MNRILRLALGLLETVIESVCIKDGLVIVRVRPWKRAQLRCPECGRTCEAYDAKPKPRRWRALDLARSMCFLECRIVRVASAEGARWIANVVAACTDVERVMDPFHVVSWMTDALDEVRKMAWRDARAVEAGVPKR